MAGTMDSATMTQPDLQSVETLLRDELARGDAMLSTAAPILRHFLVNEDHALFSDEIVALVRGMITDVARQLLHAQAEAARLADRTAFLAEREGALAERLASESALLSHVHALALEGQLTLRLQALGNLDPVLTPLLQELVAAEDDVVSGIAMAALAAQARFIQHHRRMSLPLGELPAELLHKALLLFRSQAADSEDAAAAERALRQSHDESRGRLGLVSRLVMRMGQRAPEALDIGHAGLAIFATALSMAAGQERERTVLFFSDRQYARLALTLCAAGLEPAAVEEQFVHLHPDVALPEGFEMLSGERAARLLAASAPSDGN
jgi:hypothetical protein